MVLMIANGPRKLDWKEVVTPLRMFMWILSLILHFSLKSNLSVEEQAYYI